LGDKKVLAGYKDRTSFKAVGVSQLSGGDAVFEGDAKKCITRPDNINYPAFGRCAVFELFGGGRILIGLVNQFWFRGEGG
jgi:hypothetical protein